MRLRLRRRTRSRTLDADKAARAADTVGGSAVATVFEFDSYIGASRVCVFCVFAYVCARRPSSGWMEGPRGANDGECVSWVLVYMSVTAYSRWNANALVHGAKAPRFVSFTTAKIFLHTTLQTLRALSVRIHDS